jgi:hypothetical protein
VSWLKGVLFVLVLGAPAYADDKKVPVQAEVVVASTQAGAVDPALAPMQLTLATRVKYRSMHKVSSVRLELSAAPSSVALPNQKVAEVTLLGVKDNVAQLRLKVPPLDATYSLGKEKSLYVQAGPHAGGDLWLVLSQPK